MDIDTFDIFLNFISDTDIFKGDDFFDLLVKITNYPNEEKSISLLTKLLHNIDLNEKVYKVRYEIDWPIEFFYEKTFDEVNYEGGDWDDFDYNFKGSIFTKIYFSEIGYNILRLLFNSGVDPNNVNNVNTLLDMMTKDWSVNPDMLEHKKDLVDLLLEHGAMPQYLLDYLIANDNNDYCTEVIDYLKLIISKRLLSFAKTQDMLSNMTGQDLDPKIFENISKYMRQKGSGKKKKSKTKKKI
tara:strand:- start:1621 stop:2343 length:723 start_codon:yes stop_codon:yes gene_type:complete